MPLGGSVVTLTLLYNKVMGNFGFGSADKNSLKLSLISFLLISSCSNSFSRSLRKLRDK
jgi:hypothetical protein